MTRVYPKGRIKQRAGIQLLHWLRLYIDISKPLVDRLNPIIQAGDTFDQLQRGLVLLEQLHDVVQGSIERGDDIHRVETRRIQSSHTKVVEHDIWCISCARPVVLGLVYI